jgi:zinc transport system ATP-binding protein
MSITEQHIIAVKNLSYSYEHERVLENVSVSVSPGEFVGIIGPNGGGKSTFVKILLGLLKPDSGAVSLFGKGVESFKDWHRIGYVSQHAAHMSSDFPISVNEVISMSNSDKDAIQKAINTVGLAEYDRKLVRELSGGQKQRVFIARAIATNPSLLVLDEPTVGVDAESQDAFYTLLRTLHETKKLTILLISHDIEVIAREVNSVICLNKNLIYHGLPNDIVNSDAIQSIYGKHARFIAHTH